MSETRFCDTCGHVYSHLDEGARRINIEEQVKEGARYVTQSVQRDMCAGCVDRMKLGARQPAAIEAADQDDPAEWQ
jgi:hypothetical protein